MIKLIYKYQSMIFALVFTAVCPLTVLAQVDLDKVRATTNQNRQSICAEEKKQAAVQTLLNEIFYSRFERRGVVHFHDNLVHSFDTSTHDKIFVELKDGRICEVNDVTYFRWGGTISPDTFRRTFGHDFRSREYECSLEVEGEVVRMPFQSETRVIKHEINYDTSACR